MKTSTHAVKPPRGTASPREGRASPGRTGARPRPPSGKASGKKGRALEGAPASHAAWSPRKPPPAPLRCCARRWSEREEWQSDAAGKPPRS